MPVIEDAEESGIEELIQIANLAGAKTVIVPENADEQSANLLLFGGVAAILRYPEQK